MHSGNCIWKCRLENGGHFVSASMCLIEWQGLRLRKGTMMIVPVVASRDTCSNGEHPNRFVWSQDYAVLWRTGAGFHMRTGRSSIPCLVCIPRAHAGQLGYEGIWIEENLKNKSLVQHKAHYVWESEPTNYKPVCISGWIYCTKYTLWVLIKIVHPLKAEFCQLWHHWGHLITRASGVRDDKVGIMTTRQF